MLDIIEDHHLRPVMEISLQEIDEIVTNTAMRSALDHGVLESRIEKIRRCQGDLQKLHAAVRALDPALEQGGAGGFVVQLAARDYLGGLGHGGEYRKFSRERQNERSERV
jgi:hypothetical protein